MDDKSLKKRLRGKLMMHMLFGLGGAVVIIGALFKILHLEIGPITGGLVLGLGLGTEAVNDMFADGFEFSYLFILLIAKILMTAVCIGFGLFGGVFSPALFVGASIGAIPNKIVAMMGLGAVSYKHMTLPTKA